MSLPVEHRVALALLLRGQVTAWCKYVDAETRASLRRAGYVVRFKLTPAGRAAVLEAAQ